MLPRPSVLVGSYAECSKDLVRLLFTYLPYEHLDEIALYDRQIRVWGVKAQEKYAMFIRKRKQRLTDLILTVLPLLDLKIAIGQHSPYQLQSLSQ